MNGIAATDVADDEVGRRGPTTAGEVAILSVGAGFGALSAVGLALALVGWHRGLPVVVVGVLVAVATAVVLVRRAPGGVVVDRLEVGLLAAVILVAAAFALPGFNYGAKDKDPGTYIAHAFAIEREHSHTFPDPAFDAAVPVDTSRGLPVILTGEGGIAMRCCLTYSAMKVDPDEPDHLIPSFFHAWPTLLATALSVGGRVGLFHVGPLVAVLSVAALFLTVRRSVGTLTAVLAAGLLSTNMMQVWQARYPTTEVAMQATFTLAALGIAVGLARRWRLPLALAGVTVGVSFLFRPDALLLVLLLGGVAAVMWALRWQDWAVPPLVGGTAVTLPFGFYHAYVSVRLYTEGKIPSFPVVLAGLVALAAAAVVVRRLDLGPRALHWMEGRSPRLAGRSIQWWTGVVLALAVLGLAAAFAAAWLRPHVLGQNFGIGRTGELVRKYDEANLERLTWFLTPVFVPLTVAGFALLALWRRAWGLVGILVPGLALTPIFLWEPRIAPHMMWWTRRYVPVVLVFFLVCCAAALAWLILHRGRGRVLTTGLGVALAAWMAVVGLSQSWELRDHDEWGGSLEIIDSLAAFGDEEPTIYVWVSPSQRGGGPDITLQRVPYRIFAATMLTHHGHPSIAVRRVNEDRLQALVDAYPDRRVLVVTGDPQSEFANDELVGVVQGEITFWTPEVERRPDAALTREVQFFLYDWS